jgi:uncharacterized membrane protein
MSANVFDIRAALLAKHAQHVVLIHFPIALFVTAVAFDYLQQWTKTQAMSSAAYFNFLMAAFFMLPVLASGIGAWQWALDGQNLKGTLLLHLIFGFVSAVFVWAVFWIHLRARRNSVKPPPRYRLLVEAFAAVMIGVTSHLGGFLSGVN